MHPHTYNALASFSWRRLELHLHRRGRDHLRPRRRRDDRSRAKAPPGEAPPALFGGLATNAANPKT